jgi:hypothetical protein
MDWQGRASELINLIDPERSFKRGEFESMDDAAWATLVAELRAKALTEEKLAEIRQREAQKEQQRAAALSKLSKTEKEALGL